MRLESCRVESFGVAFCALIFTPSNLRSRNGCRASISALVEYSLAGSMQEGSNRDTWMEFAENVQRNRSGNRRKRDWRWPGIAIMLAVIALSCWALWHFDLHALVGR